MRALLSTLTCLLLLATHAQTTNNFAFEAKTDIPVITMGNDTLSNAWAGGLNYVQVHPIDLDLDGTKDLMVFDRNSRRILTFVSRTKGGTPHYKYAPQYEVKFPIPYSWIILKDYNCDGKNDIFFSGNNAVLVWKNTSTTELSFQDAVGGPLQEVLNGGMSNLFISRGDVPAITDIDNDGDLDILCFANGGVWAEWHENLASCGLNFRLEESCWGHFLEMGLSREIDLVSCPPFKKKTMHSGSTMLALDLDDDEVKDLLVGNVSFTTVTALYNEGSPDSAYMAAQDTLFPSYAQSIDLFLFPALTYTDVTHDGVPDLLASPFSGSDGANNINSVHQFTNQGSESNPVFSFTKSNFLQEGMIDLGEGAIPRLVDLTGDSLLDLVVGNTKAYDSTAGLLEHFYHYYENTGTAENPAFTLVDNDFMNISSFQIGNRSVPAFGDLDGDGDQDMVIGAANGQLHYFTNSSALSPNFTLHTAGLSFFGDGRIDVGNNAAPFLYDMDMDGDLDLVVGNRNGHLSYYTNTSSSAPEFHFKSDFYGSVDTWSSDASSGNSIPYVFGKDSIPSLFVGSHQTGLFQYDNVKTVSNLPGKLTGTFGTGTLVSSNFEESPFGINKKNGRNQFLIRASELKDQGLVAGNITHLGFNVLTSHNKTVYDVRIRIKPTDDTILTSFASDMSKVYSASATYLDQGWNSQELHTPFPWDGESGLIVEVCFSGQPIGNQTAPYFIEVQMTDVGFDSHAIGDYVDPTLSAEGCEQPFKKVIQKRPNVKVEMSPTFSETEGNFAHVRNTAPALGDLNNDGFPDLILGNQGGGLTYYKGKKYNVSTPEETSVAEAKPELQIFPNPGNGVFHLELDAPGNAHLQVFDLTGKLVLTKEITQKISTVDMSNKSTGIYLFVLNGDEGMMSQKVVLE